MTKTELIAEMESLKSDMFKVGCHMEYFGGFSVIAGHGKELVGAAHILQTWIDGLKAEERQVMSQLEQNEQDVGDIDGELITVYCAECDEEYTLPEDLERCPFCWGELEC